MKKVCCFIYSFLSIDLVYSTTSKSFHGWYHHVSNMLLLLVSWQYNNHKKRIINNNNEIFNNTYTQTFHYYFTEITQNDLFGILRLRNKY